jgi:hypothetical protein
MKKFLTYPPADLGAEWDITNYFLKYFITTFSNFQ